MNTILHIAKANGFPYTLISKFNMQITQTISLPPSHNSTPSNPQNWVTFTYHNPMKRKITDLFKSTNIQITYLTNNAIYNSMVKSVLIYGAETWSLYEDDRRRINATEMDALR